MFSLWGLVTRVPLLRPSIPEVARLIEVFTHVGGFRRESRRSAPLQSVDILLHDCIRDAFSACELRAWLCQSDETATILASLPEHASLDLLCWETVQALKRRRLIDQQLLASLARARPRHIEDIRRIAAHLPT